MSLIGSSRLRTRRRNSSSTCNYSACAVTRRASRWRSTATRCLGIQSKLPKMDRWCAKSGTATGAAIPCRRCCRPCPGRAHAGNCWRRPVRLRAVGDRSAAELAALAPQEPPWKLANCRVDNSPFNWSTMHDFLRSELEAADQEDDARAVDIDTLIDRLQHDDELRASLRRGQADIQAGRVRRHVQL